MVNANNRFSAKQKSKFLPTKESIENEEKTMESNSEDIEKTHSQTPSESTIETKNEDELNMADLSHKSLKVKKKVGRKPGRKKKVKATEVKTSNKKKKVRKAAKKNKKAASKAQPIEQIVTSKVSKNSLTKKLEARLSKQQKEIVDQVNLRIPRDVLEKLDGQLGKISRNAWIVELIKMQLED